MDFFDVMRAFEEQNGVKFTEVECPALAIEQPSDRAYSCPEVDLRFIRRSAWQFADAGGVIYRGTTQFEDEEIDPEIARRLHQLSKEEFAEVYKSRNEVRTFAIRDHSWREVVTLMRVGTHNPLMDTNTVLQEMQKVYAISPFAIFFANPAGLRVVFRKQVLPGDAQSMERIVGQFNVEAIEFAECNFRLHIWQAVVKRRELCLWWD